MTEQERPRTEAGRMLLTVPDSRWHEFVNLVYRLVPDGDVRGPIIGSAVRLGAGRAVQGDGLDVERLTQAMADVLAGHHWKDHYPAEVAARYTALRDYSESGQPKRDFSADALTLDRIPVRDASESGQLPEASEPPFGGDEPYERQR